MSESNWLLPGWFKSIVCLAKPTKPVQDSNGMYLEGSEFSPIGTGFLLSYKNLAFLVTNRHVVEDKKTKNIREDLCVLYNLSKIADSQIIPLKDIHETTACKWVFHPNENIDIAVSPFLWNPVESDLVFIPKDIFQTINTVAEGDDLFFLGFPLALGVGAIIKIGEPKRITPIVRSGIISFKNEAEKTLLVEAASFPGSSGSPVFLKPAMVNHATRQIL